MTIPSSGTRVPSPRPRLWRRFSTRRGRERAAVLARNLTLASAGTAVPLSLVADDPMLLHLAVEDLCWQLAVEDLDRHRPRRGDRGGHDAWSAERARLEAERKQLAEKVTESISVL